MGTIVKDLGIATAYGYAVSKGYTGTEEEFATLMASYATVAEEAAESASAAGTSATSAAESATSASASATTAGTAASTATTKAGEASASASTASTAATTATTKAGEANQSATNAANSATAAGNAQTAAETAQGKAEDAQAAAEAAQEAAEEAAATLVLDDTLTEPTQAAESKAVGDALANKAPVIITSSSGSIANIPDGGEDLPIENLVVSIEPKQSGSGDPSPTNVRPITGWDGCEVVRCGKNLLNTTDLMTNKFINANATIGEPVTLSNSLASKVIVNGCYIEAGENYILSWTTNGTIGSESYRIGVITDANGNVLENNITTWVSNKNYSEITPTVSGYLWITMDNSATNINLGEGSTYLISWVATSGTVYGGRVNVTTGELIVTHGIVDLGTLTWVKADESGQYFSETNFGAVTDPNLLCTMFKYGNAYLKTNNNTIELRIGTYHRTWVYSTAYMGYSALNFKAAMRGVMLCYHLATPLTYQLTPTEIKTLLGQNNIWADCGDTEVEYRADTKLYIERLTQPTEDDMIADHAIANGAFFMIGNNLYRATAAIASGATIIVGTNATKLSLADALNALS